MDTSIVFRDKPAMLAYIKTVMKKEIYTKRLITGEYFTKLREICNNNSHFVIVYCYFVIVPIKESFDLDTIKLEDILFGIVVGRNVM